MTWILLYFISKCYINKGLATDRASNYPRASSRGLAGSDRGVCDTIIMMLVLVFVYSLLPLRSISGTLEQHRIRVGSISLPKAVVAV